MTSMLRTVLDDRTENVLGRTLAIYGILLAFNTAAWLWAILVFHQYPVLLGTALLAYSFGLRHAVDADHIAAIDNVTRKLMQEGKRPKNTDLTNYSQSDLNKVALRLNQRPRQTLGFQTPASKLQESVASTH